MNKNMNKLSNKNENILNQLLAEISDLDQFKTDNKMSISACIADRIIHSGLSKVKLAEQLSKRPSEITKWLSGTHNFTIDTLSEIAFLFKLELVELIHGDSNLYYKNEEFAKINKTDVKMYSNIWSRYVQRELSCHNSPFTGYCVTDRVVKKHEATEARELTSNAICN